MTPLGLCAGFRTLLAPVPASCPHSLLFSNLSESIGVFGAMTMASDGLHMILVVFVWPHNTKTTATMHQLVFMLMGHIQGYNLVSLIKN